MCGRSDTNAPLGGTGGGGGSEGNGRLNGAVLPFAITAHDDDKEHLDFRVSVSAPPLASGIPPSLVLDAARAVRCRSGIPKAVPLTANIFHHTFCPISHHTSCLFRKAIDGCSSLLEPQAPTQGTTAPDMSESFMGRCLGTTERRRVPAMSLFSLFDELLPEGAVIDFLKVS